MPTEFITYIRFTYKCKLKFTLKFNQFRFYSEIKLEEGRESVKNNATNIN